MIPMPTVPTSPVHDVPAGPTGRAIPVNDVLSVLTRPAIPVNGVPAVPTMCRRGASTSSVPGVLTTCGVLPLPVHGVSAAGNMPAVRAVVLTDGLVFVRGVALMFSLVLGLRACLETGATWMTSPAFIRGGHPLPTCPLVPRPTFTLHAPEMSSLLGASCAIGFFTIVYEVRGMT